MKKNRVRITGRRLESLGLAQGCSQGDGVVCAPMEWKMANYRRIVPKVCSCSRFHYDLEQFSVERLGGVR